jgi:uncharacterized protein (DUF1697 family)
MADLKKLYEELHFSHVTTYIQSGNVIFQGKPADTHVLSKLIESRIDDTFGFDVPVIVRTVDEMRHIVKHNPFLKNRGQETDTLHVTFLSGQPETTDGVPDGKLYAPDSFILSGKEVYLDCPNGYGNTKLNNTFFEKKLRVTATTRNWKTTCTLLELAEQN